MAKIFFNVGLQSPDKEIAWSAKNGATKTELKLINKLGNGAELKDGMSGKIGWLSTNRTEYVFVNAGDPSKDSMIIGIFLNRSCGARVISGKALFEGHSFGGPSNSQSSLLVCELGAVVEEDSYNHRHARSYSRLEVDGWKIFDPALQPCTKLDGEIE